MNEGGEAAGRDEREAGEAGWKKIRKESEEKSGNKRRKRTRDQEKA